jgi:hypothetical protein
MCSYAAPVGFRAETLQDTKSIFTMHTGKGVRVVGSLQQWWNQSISTFEDCRTLSCPKELLKTIIELSLTKAIYLTLIKDMYWSKWLLYSYSCFSWDSIWPLYLCLCSPCDLFFCFFLFYVYLKWIESYCIFDREGEVASSWMLHEEMF